MRCIIAGGRDFNDYPRLKQEMDNYPDQITEVICGGALGADALGKRWAEENNIPVSMYPAKWNTYGKSAGYRRNVEMAENGDVLIAFWDGMSKGTKHMIDIAHNKRVDYVVYYYGKEDK